MKRENRRSTKLRSAVTGAATQRELAEAMNRSEGVVSRWVRRDDWPFNRRPPWSAETVVQIRAWAETTLAPNPAAAAIDSLEVPRPTDRADERSAKLRILRERGSLLELERRKAEGLLVDREEVERRGVRQVLAVREAMRLAGVRLSEALVYAKDRAEIERIVTDEMRLVCNAFADGQTPYAADAGDKDGEA